MPAPTLMSVGRLIPNWPGSTTLWNPVASSYMASSAGGVSGVGAEAGTQTPYRHGGTFSYLAIFISSDCSAFTLTLRANGADSALVVATPSAPVGEFIDTTHTVVIAAGDVVSTRGVGGSGGASQFVFSISVQFQATGTTAARFGVAENAGAYGTSNTTYYEIFVGQVGGGTGEFGFMLPNYGELSGLATATVSTTSRSATIQSRVNGSNGTQSVAVPTSMAGLFQDTTHLDAVAAGDLVNVSITTATGTGSMALNFINQEFAATSGAALCASGGLSSFPSAASSSFQSCIAGSVFWRNITAGDVNVITVHLNATARNLHLYVDNARSSTTNVWFRLNAANTALTVAVGAALSGWFLDTTHTVAVVSGDIATYRLTTGTGSGTFTAIHMGMTLLGAADVSYEGGIMSAIVLNGDLV